MSCDPVVNNTKKFDFFEYTKKTAREVGNFLCETPPEILAYTVAGIALQIFRREMAPPFLFAAVASLATRLTVKIIDKVKPNLLDSAKQEAYRIDSKYPELKTIVLVAAVVTGIFSPIGGAFFGFALGIYSGLSTSVGASVISRVASDLARKDHLPLYV